MVAAGCFTRPSAIAPKTGKTRSPSIFSQAEFAGPSATPKLRPCLTSRPPLPATPKFPRRIRRKSNVYPLSIRGSSVRLFLLATILSHRLSHIGLHLCLHIDLCRIDVYTYAHQLGHRRQPHPGSPKTGPSPHQKSRGNRRPRRIHPAPQATGNHFALRHHRLRRNLQLQTCPSNETHVIVLVDTSIWSLSMRRRPRDLGRVERSLVAELAELISEGRSRLLGLVRQEVLSGIRTQAQLEDLRAALRAFPDVVTDTADYESAAEASNRCQARGVTVSVVDALICAVALNRGWAIFTTDIDFEHHARILPITLHACRK